MNIETVADSYAQESHARWYALFTGQMRVLDGHVYYEFLEGLDALGITQERIPDLQALNTQLERVSGWSIDLVPGTVTGKLLFKKLSEKRFPVCTVLRSAEYMEFAPFPDLFHDLFGHLPMLMHPLFATFLHRFGIEGAQAAGEDRVSAFERLYFRTWETGLIQTNQGLRIYGAACVSSKGEAEHCLTAPINRIRFDAELVMKMPIDDSKYQSTYFIIEDFSELMIF